MQTRTLRSQSHGRPVNPSERACKDWSGGTCVLLLLVAAVAVSTGAAASAPRESRREHITKLAAQIKRADYEGDRAALKRLYQELAPFADDKELGTRVRYWRGFAMWRRALNGFNDSADPSELEQSLKQAISEFQEAMTKDPAFIDAKSSAGSCMGLLMFLYGKNPALAPEFNDANRRREFLLKALSYMNEAEAEEPKNPRVFWVLGGTAGSAVPSCVFDVRNLRGMAKGEQDARRGSVFDL